VRRNFASQFDERLFVDEARVQGGRSHL